MLKWNVIQIFLLLLRYKIHVQCETENLDENAIKKLKGKRADMIAANLVGNGQTFGQDASSLKVFWKGGYDIIEHAPKEEVAEVLIELIAGHIQQNLAQTMVVR